VLCHGPDFSAEDYKKILECKHENGYTKINPTNFPGLATPLCDKLLEGASYTRQLVYHQAYSGALEPYYKCNACPAHLCEPCYEGNICLFLYRRRIVSLFNLGLLNVRRIPQKYLMFFVMLVVIIIQVKMAPIVQCYGPNIDYAARTNDNTYRDYVTGQYEGMREL